MRKLVLCVLALIAGCSAMYGQQYKVLWRFGGFPNDGAAPVSNLILDNAGNLYGTTASGGSGGSFGGGTLFKLSPNGDGSWSNSTIYNFCTNVVNHQCLDGAFPQAGLLFDSKGNLYGTSKNGGTKTCPFDAAGCGVIFELSPPQTQGGAWTEIVLYNFCASISNNTCLDDAAPVSQLTADAAGNFYTTTSRGGTRDKGSVVRLSNSGGTWTESVLYSFCASGQGEVCPNGAQPVAGVTFDKLGNLYGTTPVGGSHTTQGGGTVYMLSPKTGVWTETVLYFFLQPYNAGGGPTGTVSFDALGNLYSTFSGGGKEQAGGAFRLTAKNGGKVRTFSFDPRHGEWPLAGPLLDSRHAVLYGTTSRGGTFDGGVAFKITAPAEETVLYNFCSLQNCEDGGGSVASLIADKAGNLYGTTKGGGSNFNGVVFEIAQSPQPASSAALRNLLAPEKK